jgi:NADH:ubiquinone oxidoreductase subunit D
LLDPLAPIAGQLAYTSAVEQLQGSQPSGGIAALRSSVLALERVHNTLWWLVHVARILADTEFIDRAYQLATDFVTRTSNIWRQPPTAWIAPQQSVVLSTVSKNPSAIALLPTFADHVEAVSRYVERNRWLALRTRGIGFLATERLKAAGVSGPVLFGSEHVAGDVHSRLAARLHAATIDVRAATETLTGDVSYSIQEARWDIPAGEAHAAVRGPRGDIGLHLVSNGGEKPARVEWRRPSSALLPLLPEILAGQKLVDAEVIVASLDLAMAEADG